MEITYDAKKNTVDITGIELNADPHVSSTGKTKILFTNGIRAQLGKHQATIRTTITIPNKTK